jgi:glycosyltransferase involved in cell wall biosynthesis
VEALEAAPDLDISASWFCRDDLWSADSFLERADALVLCRTAYDTHIQRLITRARARRIPVLFDIDDLIFDPDYTHLILETLDQQTEGDHVWNHWFGMIGRVGATLRQCDNAVVTNEVLAGRIKKFAPWMEPRVVPNFFNRRQQRISSNIFHAKCASDFARDGTLCAGYFSGTPTHNRDFAVAATALVSLLQEYPQLVIRMVGFLEPKGPLLTYKDRIAKFPLQDFLNLQRLIGQTEINIAPLQLNDFTNCKSELKYFEAAIVGTMTIASPTFTFERVIDDGYNALLARPQEWEDKIRAAIEIAEDPARYREMAEIAYKQAEEAYSWHKFGDAIEAAVFGNQGVRSLPLLPLPLVAAQ